MGFLRQTLLQVQEHLKGLALSAHQHSQAVVSVAGCGDAPDRAEHAHRDFTVFDQFRDVGQVQGVTCRVLRGGVFVYATCCISSCMLAATFHGSNSSR